MIKTSGQTDISTLWTCSKRHHLLKKVKVMSLSAITRGIVMSLSDIT